MNPCYLDDLQPGQRFTTGTASLSAEEIVAFARQYDPQPFHIDADAGAASHFGGLIASGLHTLSLASRLVQAAKPWGTNAMGSPGIEQLSWNRPVRPGDRIHVVIEIQAVQPSRSKPDRGVASLQFEIFNQADELVMRYLLKELIARRPAGG